MKSATHAHCKVPLIVPLINAPTRMVCATVMYTVLVTSDNAGKGSVGVNASRAYSAQLVTFEGKVMGGLAGRLDGSDELLLELVEYCKRA